MVPSSSVTPTPLATPKLQKIDIERREPRQIPSIREVLRIAYLGADVGLIDAGVIDIVRNLAQSPDNLRAGQGFQHSPPAPSKDWPGNSLNPLNGFSASDVVAWTAWAAAGTHLKSCGAASAVAGRSKSSSRLLSHLRAQKPPMANADQLRDRATRLLKIAIKELIRLAAEALDEATQLGRRRK